MSHSFMWLPHSLRNPYIQELIKHERNSDEGIMEFNGYFYIEDESCPVERIIAYDEKEEDGSSNSYHIEIYEKKTIRDTSYDGYDKDNKSERQEGDDEDEFGGRICFFPTAIIHLKYRVLEKIKGMDEMMCIHENILEQEDEFRERDMKHRSERTKREMEKAAEDAKNIDYKSFFAKHEEKKAGEVKYPSVDINYVI